MLTIIVPELEYFNEETEMFYVEESFVLHLEHSLVSLSKWESKFKKPFLSAQKKSDEETFYYIYAMIINAEIPNNLSNRLSQQNLDDINDYIESSESATTFGDMPERNSKQEVITSELIYYWMVAFSIPFECEVWHINRLFALVKICNLKNSKSSPSKLTKNQLAQRRAEINAKRRADLGSTG